MILITGNDPPTTMMWSELLARASLTPKPVAGWRAHGPLVRSAHVRRRRQSALQRRHDVMWSDDGIRV